MISLILQESKIEIVVNMKEFLQVIDCVFLLVREGCNNVVKFFVKLVDLFEILLNFLEIGKVVEVVLVDQIDGEELNILFSLKYMMDVLKVFEGVDICISFMGVMRLFFICMLNDEIIVQFIFLVRMY